MSVLSLLNLSAAFDTIDHDILLKRHYITFGIQGTALDWFRSYMANRLQTVVVEGIKSKTVPLEHGVPQGSVLEPVLFSLYTEPLNNFISRQGCTYCKFADDTQLGNTGPLSKFEETKLELELSLDEVGSLMISNKLKLNEDKTEAIKIATRNKLKHLESRTGINIETNNIPFTPHVKNLGVYLDSELNTNSKIGNVYSLPFLEIRRIGRVQKLLSLKSAIQLTCSRVLTRIDYCNSLLAGVAKEQKQRLQSVQNTMAKILIRRKRRDHAKPALRELHWLPVEQRIDYKNCYFSLHAFFGHIPPYLSDKLTICSPSRSLRSASKQLLTVPRSKMKTAGMKSFSYQAPVIWNNLPIEVRDSRALHTFKRSLKTHLFEQAFSEI